MDINKAKSELLSLDLEREKLKFLKKQLHEMKGDTKGNFVIEGEIALCEKQIGLLEERVRTIKLTIIEKLFLLQHPYSAILRMKYLDKKHCDTIAEACGYSVSHLSRLINEGIRQYSQIDDSCKDE
jgi:hypothetical protein